MEIGKLSHSLHTKRYRQRTKMKERTDSGEFRNGIARSAILSVVVMAGEVRKAAAWTHKIDDSINLLLSR